MGASAVAEVEAAALRRIACVLRGEARELPGDCAGLVARLEAWAEALDPTPGLPVLRLVTEG